MLNFSPESKILSTRTLLLLRPKEMICVFTVSGNILEKVRSPVWKKFLFYEKFLIELFRKITVIKAVF